MAGRIIAETERLWLREFDEDDAENYFLLGSDPRVIQYTGAERLMNLEQALQVLRERPLADYQQHGFGRWACVLKATGGFIGWAGLKYLEDVKQVDLGYWLLPAYWGSGFATEAAAASLKHGFEQLHLTTIIANVDPENVRSMRVVEKLGMARVGYTEFQGTTYIKYQIQAPTQLSV